MKVYSHLLLLSKQDHQSPCQPCWCMIQLLIYNCWHNGNVGVVKKKNKQKKNKATKNELCFQRIDERVEDASTWELVCNNLLCTHIHCLYFCTFQLHLTLFVWSWNDCFLLSLIYCRLNSSRASNEADVLLK